jgi:hypothetical protein
VEGLAGEEVGLGALQRSVVGAGSVEQKAGSVERGARSRGRRGLYILEEAKQVSNSFALAVGQDGVIDAVF